MRKILFSILLLFTMFTFSNSRLDTRIFKSNINYSLNIKKDILKSKVIPSVNGNNLNNGEINYTPTVSYDFDGIATLMGQYMENGLKSLQKIGIFIVSVLFGIQLTIDLYSVYATLKLEEFFKTFIKRLMTFSLYLFAIRKIVDGTVFRVVEELSYQLLKLLTGEPGIQKLSNIWRIKNQVTYNVWQGIANLWGAGSFFPSEFVRDFILTLILLAIIVFLNIAFFMMMLNLFKALISFKLVLGLSTILIPLGIMDSTKEYYNIGKVLSMGLNFSIKLISINFIAAVIMKTLTNNNSVLNLSVTDVSTALSSNFIVFLLLISVMGHLITKVEINF
ncbi:type IV secretion system protein [Streptobacillus moniliformis]|uniref:type IV secretion system protein n=1 Tax=Streptobacillus moniliformis TaxID=34105 RepID=UPI0007E4D488|nr:type IV secretion system protein [Streptobacillus moniliformis]